MPASHAPDFCLALSCKHDWYVSSQLPGGQALCAYSKSAIYHRIHAGQGRILTLIHPVQQQRCMQLKGLEGLPCTRS